MTVEIRVPSVGESVKEAILAEWFKQDGDLVRKDEPLFIIETDKVTLEVTAQADGVLRILAARGQTVAVGAVVGMIETRAESPAATRTIEQTPVAVQSETETPRVSPPAEAGAPGIEAPLPPSVRRLAKEKQVDLSLLKGTGPGGRITKGDVILHLEAEPSPPPAASLPEAPGQDVTRKPMSPIRRRIAARLLEARQNTAMLTTFNEIDMDRVMELRAAYKDSFQKKHGVALGFMSFFTKACVAALLEIPEINAFIEGDEIVYHHHQHIGMAIGSERGLVVPVIRHAESLSLAQIEKAIAAYVEKIKTNRLALADLEGGTFTISNGGVYGSLLSTPILNMPQSGILGLHKIEKRPVVVDEAIVIRPMMYVALSYDHRIVDGREAVTFLRRVKEFIETPERMMMEI